MTDIVTKIGRLRQFRKATTEIGKILAYFVLGVTNGVIKTGR